MNNANQMTSFTQHPLLYAILAMFRTEKAGIKWTDNDVRVFSPDTPPSNEYYPKKRTGSVSPPILKYPTKPA